MELFKDADKLPDGTLITVRKAPPSQGGKHAIEWTVDTYSEDGLRVVISSVNARAYNLPAGRPTPALDIEQLKKIALDAVWKKALS
jgi:hypothetical protein